MKNISLMPATRPLKLMNHTCRPDRQATQAFKNGIDTPLICLNSLPAVRQVWLK